MEGGGGGKKELNRFERGATFFAQETLGPQERKTIKCKQDRKENRRERMKLVRGGGGKTRRACERRERCENRREDLNAREKG